MFGMYLSLLKYEILVWYVPASCVGYLWVSMSVTSLCLPFRKYTIAPYLFLYYS